VARPHGGRLRDYLKFPHALLIIVPGPGRPKLYPHLESSDSCVSSTGSRICCRRAWWAWSWRPDCRGHVAHSPARVQCLHDHRHHRFLSPLHQSPGHRRPKRTFRADHRAWGFIILGNLLADILIAHRNRPIFDYLLDATDTSRRALPRCFSWESSGSAPPMRCGWRRESSPSVCRWNSNGFFSENAATSMNRDRVLVCMAVWRAGELSDQAQAGVGACRVDLEPAEPPSAARPAEPLSRTPQPTVLVGDRDRAGVVLYVRFP